MQYNTKTNFSYLNEYYNVKYILWNIYFWEDKYLFLFYFQIAFNLQAEELLVVEFPKRILKINKLLAKPEFSTAALEPSNFKLDIPMNLILQQNAM